MRLFVIFLAVAPLAACVAPAAPVGAGPEIRFGGATYPIERLESYPEQWRVITPTGPVACRAPTQEDCYWSLRAYLKSQETPDVLP